MPRRRRTDNYADRMQRLRYITQLRNARGPDRDTGRTARRPGSNIQRRIYRATGLSRTMTNAARREQTRRNTTSRIGVMNNPNYRYIAGEMNRGVPVFGRNTGKQVGAMVPH